MKRQLRRVLRPLLRRLPVIGTRWDPVARRRWLLEKMPTGSATAEIGVWKGDFSAEILSRVEPGRLYLIDPWQPAPPGSPAWMGTDATRQDVMDGIHAAVVSRFEREIDAGKVVVLRSPSVQAAASIPDDSLDWVYIDGDHRYEAVRDDISTYRAKVRPGGFVCGDDYGEVGSYGRGVKQAVDEQIASGGWAVIALRGYQFILQRTEQT